jgi:hypothetical protein
VTPPRSMDRGPMTTPVETLILVWVIGMVWSEVKQLWEEGFVKYVFQVRHPCSHPRRAHTVHTCSGGIGWTL